MKTTWTRAELKSKAKAVLKGTYLIAFVVSLIMSIVSSGNSNFNFGRGSNSYNTSSQYEVTQEYPRDFEDGPVFSIEEARSSHNPARGFIASIFALQVLVISFILIILKVVIGNTIEAGGRRYFIDTATNGENKLSTIVLFFKNGAYRNVAWTLFKRDLFTSLWTLLFIIPGIIKSYEYRFIPYILADNPNISSKRAFELSKQMSQDQKMEMFLLDISFIPWTILGLCLFVLGVFLVFPYINATEAQLYIKIRDHFIDNGYIRAEELDLVPITSSTSNIDSN